MDLRDVLLTLHILFAIVIIGWLAMQSMIVPGLIRQGPENAAAVRASAAVSKKLGPASSVVFLLGIWLGLRDGDGPIDMGDPWLSASMGLFVVTAVLGGAIGGKAEMKAAEKLTAGQPALEEAKRLSIVGTVNMVLLVAIVYLMVDKPGLA